jgi:hypothetical protein
MKVTVMVKLEGNIELPVSADIETLADLRKLGAKLAAMPAGANKLMPGIAERKVTSLKFDKE